MKRYLQHIKTKSTHQRRGHAMQIATVATAFVFVVWVTTLGVRLTGSGSAAVVENSDAEQTQLAQVASGAYAPSGGNMLEVATTTSSF
ncbi:MAG: hypothetical protein Q7S26_00475 [bacterium]|nr:hypothetical protein [bacterium]